MGGLFFVSCGQLLFQIAILLFVIALVYEEI
jgi:hypothetical protein